MIWRAIHFHGWIWRDIDPDKVSARRPDDGRDIEQVEAMEQSVKAREIIAISEVSFPVAHLRGERDSYCTNRNSALASERRMFYSCTEWTTTQGPELLQGAGRS